MQISGSIRIRMSAGWLPKCCGFITLSSATVTPTSIVKIHPWVYAKCWNWSELPHSAITARKVEKWFRIHVWDKSPPRALILYRRRRFINHLLTYLLTTSKQTDKGRNKIINNNNNVVRYFVSHLFFVTCVISCSKIIIITSASVKLTQTRHSHSK